MSAGSITPDWWRRSAVAILAEPRLWPTAVGQAFRLAAPGWWRRRPFLPLPDPTYLAFRMETQYGLEDPRPEDVVIYLHWVRQTRRSSSG